MCREGKEKIEDCSFTVARFTVLPVDLINNSTCLRESVTLSTYSQRRSFLYHSRLHSRICVIYMYVYIYVRRTAWLQRKMTSVFFTAVFTRSKCNVCPSFKLLLNISRVYMRMRVPLFLLAHLYARIYDVWFVLKCIVALVVYTRASQTFPFDNLPLIKTAGANTYFRESGYRAVVDSRMSYEQCIFCISLNFLIFFV